MFGANKLLHAQNIHSIPENKIIKIGSARYNEFLKREVKLKNYFDFEYILFLGLSWSWNEEDVLDKMDDIIEKNKNIFPNVKIYIDTIHLDKEK